MRTSEKSRILSILLSETPRQCIIIAKCSFSDVVSILQSAGMYIQFGGWKAAH